jgi:hypothetical protein
MALFQQRKGWENGLEQGYPGGRKGCPGISRRLRIDPNLYHKPHPHRKTMKELRTEIEIQAPAERIWKLLTDFAGFPRWNPFIRRVKGDLRVGNRLEVRLQPSGTRGMIFRPMVLSVEPGRELRWLGHLLVPGLFDGEHRFTIEPLGADRVRFTQSERFTGLLVPVLSR